MGGDGVRGSANASKRTFRNLGASAQSLSAPSSEVASASGAGITGAMRGDAMTTNASMNSKRPASPHTTKNQQGRNSTPTSIASSVPSPQDEEMQRRVPASLAQAHVQPAATASVAAHSHQHQPHHAHTHPSLLHLTAAVPYSIPHSHPQAPLGAAGALPPTLWMSQFVPGLSGGGPNGASASGPALSPSDTRVRAAMMSGTGGVSGFALPDPFKDEDDISPAWAGTVPSTMHLPQQWQQVQRGERQRASSGAAAHHLGAQQQLLWHLALQRPTQQPHPQVQALPTHQHPQRSTHPILQPNPRQEQQLYPPPSSTASSYTNPSLLSGTTDVSGSSGHRSSATSVSVTGAAGLGGTAATAACGTAGTGVGESAVPQSASVLSDIILADDFILSGARARAKGSLARSQLGTVKKIKRRSSTASPGGPLSSIRERRGGGASGAEGEDAGEGDGEGEEDEIEEMVRSDPLATQVWRMYARTKAQLPHAQRMENLTWRMMALALKRKNAMRAHQPPKQPQDPQPPTQIVTAPEQTMPSGSSPSSMDNVLGNHNKAELASGVPVRITSDKEPAAEDERRGRPPAKLATKTRIVGFGADDNDDDDAK